MRKLKFILILFTCPIIIFSQTGWNQIYYNDSISFAEINFLNLNTGYAVGFGLIAKTSNGGLNWERQFSSQVLIYSIHFSDNNNGFAAGENGKIYKTTNGGVNWAITETSNSYEYNSVYCLNELTCTVVGYSSIIKKTTNGGISWLDQQINQNYYSLKDIQYLNTNTGYIGGFNALGGSNEGKIFKTSNGGNNWNTVYLGEIIIQALHFTDINTGFAVGQKDLGFNNWENKILKTTNSGVNWAILNSISDIWYNDICFINQNTGYIIGNKGDSSIIIKTNNSGVNWFFQYKSFNNTGNLSSIVMIDSNNGYTCGGHQILKTSNGGGQIGIKYISEQIPTNFTLDQNFPNPFNPITKIRFYVPRSSLVKFDIFDILGKQISSLVNKNLLPGTYEIDWMAENYPSGVYYYKLTSGAFSETKKMILIK